MDLLPDAKVLRNRSRRNIGGEAALGEVPHHVIMYKVENDDLADYRAFCSGSIITETRVLSSTNCYLTNRKRLRLKLEAIHVVAAVFVTYFEKPSNNSVEQWRYVKKIYSQSYYRFPVYNIAILEMNKPWEFNSYVNKIPYATIDQSFDGVCTITAVRPTKSWEKVKYLYTIEVRLMPKNECERSLFRSCRFFLCTRYHINREIFTESEGGGLICHGTDDPAEGTKGLLVGITSLINIGLPSLHTRVGLFHKWITDATCRLIGSSNAIISVIFMNKLLV